MFTSGYLWSKGWILLQGPSPTSTPGTKLLSLAIKSLGGSYQLAKYASRFSLLSSLQSNVSFVAYHAQALSVLTHVGTVNSSLDLAKKAKHSLLELPFKLQFPLKGYGNPICACDDCWIRKNPFHDIYHKYSVKR